MLSIKTRISFNWVYQSFAFSDGRHEDFQRMPTLDDGILCAKVDLRRENEAGSHDGGSNSAEPGAQAKTSELEA